MSAITDLLGGEGEGLLSYKCKGIDKSMLTLPGPDFLDRVTAHTDRPIRVIRALQSIFNFGRLKGTGYLSILPVDQEIGRAHV